MIPTVRGYLILGNRKEVYFAKPEENSLSIGSTKFKIVKTWFNESSAFI